MRRLFAIMTTVAVLLAGCKTIFHTHILRIGFAYSF